MRAYSCQSTGSQKRDFNTSSSDLSKYLKYQSKIAENSEDESDESHENCSDYSENSSEGSYPEEEEVRVPKLEL